MHSSRFEHDDPVQHFLRVVTETCDRHGVEMYLGKGRNVRYKSLRCLGYFDSMESPSPRYAVATGRPLAEWLPIAVHELCHLAQWAEGAPAWIEQVLAPSVYALDLLGEWFAGKHLEDEEITRLIGLAREVERDCEERTLRMIVQYRLPVDLTVYAQQANSYVFYYTAMREMRRWYTRSPREVPEVWKLMPDRILPPPAYEDLPVEYREAFLKYLF
jgi:hypothetical protein